MFCPGSLLHRFHCYIQIKYCFVVQESQIFFQNCQLLSLQQHPNRGQVNVSVFQAGCPGSSPAQSVFCEATPRGHRPWETPVGVSGVLHIVFRTPSMIRHLGFSLSFFCQKFDNNSELAQHVSELCLYKKHRCKQLGITTF